MNLMEMEPGLATAMSGGPVATAERPDTEQSVMIELMGNGFAIEKNPVPVASIVARGVAAEAVLQRLSETGEQGEDSEQFVPYALTGEPEDIYGGIQVIGGDAESAKVFISKLIGAVERPEDEASTEANTRAEVKQFDESQESSRGSAAILALRRSRLGRVIAGAAVVAYGSLQWASSASGETLEQECVDAGMKPMKIIVARMHGVHSHGGNAWHGLVKGKINAMPEECTDNGYHLVFNNRVQLQNGEHPDRWSMIEPWVGSRWNGHRNDRGWVMDDGAPGYRQGFGNSAYHHNHNWTRWAYICRPGPAKTQVRYEEKHTVVHVDGTIGGVLNDRINGHIQVLDSETLDRSIKVDGAC